MPILNVLMPTFNPNLPWLRKALESVKSQRFTDYEVVLVNDGSTKVDAAEIGRLAEEILGGRVRYHNLPANVGFNRAINYALTQADARYAFVLGDDDYLVDPDYLQRVIAALEAEPAAHVAMADYILRREELDNEETIRMFPPQAPQTRDGLELFWERFWLPAVPAVGWGSLIFRVDTARSLGGFREPVGDMRLFIQLLQAGKLVYLPLVGSCYRFRQGNTSSRGNVDVLRASLGHVGLLAGEAFDRACALRPLEEGLRRKRAAIMKGRCRVHAAAHLRYFRSLGRVTLRQALALYPLVFTAYSAKGLAQSLVCLAALFLPPSWLRGLKAAVVGLRGRVRSNA